jgi:hypothetical protein
MPDDESLLHLILGLHDTYCAVHGPINRVLSHPNAAAAVSRIMHLRRAFVKGCRGVDKAVYAMQYSASGAAPPPDRLEALQALQVATCAQAAELLQLCTVSTSDQSTPSPQQTRTHTALCTCIPSTALHEMPTIHGVLMCRWPGTTAGR